MNVRGNRTYITEAVEKKALQNYFQVIKLHCFSFATGHTQPEDVIVVQTVSDASLPCQLPVQG